MLWRGPAEALFLRALVAEIPRVHRLCDFREAFIRASAAIGQQATSPLDVWRWRRGEKGAADPLSPGCRLLPPKEHRSTASRLAGCFFRAASGRTNRHAGLCPRAKVGGARSVQKLAGNNKQKRVIPASGRYGFRRSAAERNEVAA
ncbi:hypothetical protein MRX96_009785 [Rhipicephalus microplus]